jgi:hypothetical protein
MKRLVPVPTGPGVLVLPLTASVRPAATGVARDYLRRIDARRYRGALSTWEGEGGKLASAKAYRVRSGGPDFSHLMFR